MTTRERRTEDLETRLPTRPEAELAPRQERRDAGDGFLDAADLAIERALSGRAEEFLAQNRQQGGQ